MSKLLEHIASDLTVPVSMLEHALAMAHIRYRKIKVPKRSGGIRTMIQASVELKMIQAWLNMQVLNKLPISEVTTAFEPGKSIVLNAKAHQNYLYSVRVDMADFFPSIRSKDLLQTINKNSSALPHWALDTDFTHILQKACFSKDDRLPIGYTTSPKIANAVMYDIDNILIQNIKANQPRFGIATLSRYADDFVFSTNKRGACKEFITEIRNCLKSTSNPNLQLNENKTRFMSRKGGSTLITGLRINNDGEVGVHANYRDHVRLLLKLYSKDKLNENDIASLRGHLSFIQHADPGLFTKLSFKYFEEINKIRCTK